MKSIDTNITVKFTGKKMLPSNAFTSHEQFRDLIFDMLAKNGWLDNTGMEYEVIDIDSQDIECDWITVRGEGVIQCKRCGDNYMMNMPAPIGMVLAMGREFRSVHRDCEEKK